MGMRLETGLDVLVADRPDKRWGRLGLLSNQASLDASLTPAWKRIREHAGANLTALFGPQHGFFGTVQDNMIETGHETHPETGLPLFSLYSEVREPTDEMLSGIDTLVVDLQIVGCRIYTWKSTIAGCLRSAKRCQKRVVVLDRPNPLGGVHVEGRVLELDAVSFVGQFPIPMRHGLTAGEAAQFFNATIGADLEVVPLKGWDPSKTWDDYDRDWVMTSPNLPTFDSVAVYPGGVIFEGTNLSEGRGTTLPFQLYGAPYLKDPEAYLNRVIELYDGDIRGLVLRPLLFQPTFHKWQERDCGGVQVLVREPKAVSSYRLSLAILAAAYQYEGFEFTEPPYEYDQETQPMKLILGSHSFEDHLGAAFDVRDPFWQGGIDAYLDSASKHLLYPREMSVNF